MCIWYYLGIVHNYFFVSYVFQYITLFCIILRKYTYFKVAKIFEYVLKLTTQILTINHSVRSPVTYQ